MKSHPLHSAALSKMDEELSDRRKSIKHFYRVFSKFLVLSCNQAHIQTHNHNLSYRNKINNKIKKHAHIKNSQPYCLCMPIQFIIYMYYVWIIRPPSIMHLNVKSNKTTYAVDNSNNYYYYCIKSPFAKQNGNRRCCVLHIIIDESVFFLRFKWFGH